VPNLGDIGIDRLNFALPSFQLTRRLGRLGCLDSAE
jgi:hypothetical protein